MIRGMQSWIDGLKYISEHITAKPVVLYGTQLNMCDVEQRTGLKTDHTITTLTVRSLCLCLRTWSGWRRSRRYIGGIRSWWRRWIAFIKRIYQTHLSNVSVNMHTNSPKSKRTTCVWYIWYLAENRLNAKCNNGWFAGQADGRWRAATEKRHSGCQRPERAAGVQDPGVRGENVADASNSISNFQTFTCDFCLLFRRGSGAHPPSISNSSISQKASVLYRFTVRQRESLWVHPSVHLSAPVNISEGCTASMFSISRLSLCLLAELSYTFTVKLGLKGAFDLSFHSLYKWISWAPFAPVRGIIRGMLTDL